MYDVTLSTRLVVVVVEHTTSSWFLFWLCNADQLDSRLALTDDISLSANLSRDLSFRRVFGQRI